MTTSPDFAAYCAELLAPIGDVHTRRMFGDYGVYAGDAFIAIIVGEDSPSKMQPCARLALDAALRARPARKPRR